MNPNSTRIKTGKFRGLIMEREPESCAAAFKKGVRVVVHGVNGDTIYRVRGVHGEKLEWHRLTLSEDGRERWVPGSPDEARLAAGSAHTARRTKGKLIRKTSSRINGRVAASRS